MKKYFYFVAEGQHDIAFLVKLLMESFELEIIQYFSDLDSFWEHLIPRTFPPKDGDFVKRIPIPQFLQNENLSIALHSANGIEQITNTLEESLAVIDDLSLLFGIALILDADQKEKPSERFDRLIQELSAKPELSKKLDFVDFKALKLGEVEKNDKKFGVFIIPNNKDSGTLEEILIECAKMNYTDLHRLAESYIASVDLTSLGKKDRKEFKKPAGKNKAIVSSISSVLKPGKAIQVSIKDNCWIDSQTLKLENIALIREFIAKILGI
ncbi:MULTISPECIES: DUF3226 domain-containing protein [Spirulina sp. CCY15215]|uniref:DUF3226 domain-containing protein n=1 Tax=Spirulina sp. CCY15215 TaxID=2767591 RepID=UPI00194F36FB|nr:DUF3226 domain-containing protein [Spirulina major]